MDSLTQIVLGAAVGEAILGRKVGNKAILWGAIAGTIPDLDVFLKFFVDELTSTEMHRGFSHSILFATLFAPCLGWFASKIHKKSKVGWKPWSWLMFGSLITHPLLDAHTNWGTSLFWPFEYKVAYNNIFIVDPLYTIPFLVCVILAMRLKRDNPKRRKINKIGLIISSTYMLITILLKGIGYHQFTKSLNSQNIEYTNMMTNATPFNSVLWMALIETKTQYLIGYYSLLEGQTEIEFIPFNKNHKTLGEMRDEELVKRLIKLSSGWFTITQSDGRTYLNDLRFGQAGITDDPNSFFFSHELWYDKDGNLHVKQVQRPVQKIGEIMSQFLHRIVEK